jgi:hypothetical protein
MIATRTKLERRLPVKNAGVRLRAWAGILLIAVCGCGTSEYSSTEGVITLDGIPLANATVFFYAPNMPPAAATTDESGRYRVETGGTIGMMPGEYSVTVAAYGTDSYGHPIPMLVIPKKYLHSESSGLKASISTGTNRGVDFELNTDRSARSEPIAVGLDRTSELSNRQRSVR